MSESTTSSSSSRPVHTGSRQAPPPSSATPSLSKSSSEPVKGHHVTPTFADVRDTLVQTLGIQDRADTLTPQTALLDNLTELDSMAVVELLTALEDRFGITIDDGDVSGELFETLGSLTAFVQDKARA